jgi:hypothetical protein
MALAEDQNLTPNSDEADLGVGARFLTRTYVHVKLQVTIL